MCGEKFSSCRKPSSGQGSPPRVRGKGPEFVAVVLLAGITPAYAGKSAVKSLLCHRVGDHPRVCGEKFRLTSVTTPQRGSPPRMRGKELSVSAHCHICGITPAYAGKSEAVNGPGIAGKDHPRVCGEKTMHLQFPALSSGSPPRMRGKDIDGVTSSPKPGITPAYAGKSTKREKQKGKTKDHPRVCGEKLLRLFDMPCLTGSPPRMRGKESVLRVYDTTAGITPAYAGKRRAPRTSRTGSWDHPRVCGEKSKTALSYDFIRGSPPRMRGKVCQPPIWHSLDGITPAYAGKSYKIL